MGLAVSTGRETSSAGLSPRSAVVLKASPALGPAITLLVISGLGSAWRPGLDGLMLDAAPPGLRGRALALQGAGLMFTQGVGFGFWGIAGQFAPLVAVIPAAAAADLLVAWLSRRHLRRRWTDHQA